MRVSYTQKNMVSLSYRIDHGLSTNTSFNNLFI